MSKPLFRWLHPHAVFGFQISCEQRGRVTFHLSSSCFFLIQILLYRAPDRPSCLWTPTLLTLSTKAEFNLEAAGWKIEQNLTYTRQAGCTLTHKHIGYAIFGVSGFHFYQLLACTEARLHCAECIFFKMSSAKHAVHINEMNAFAGILIYVTGFYCGRQIQ